MQRLAALILSGILISGPVARAEGEPAGLFDYFVLALSWQSTWCALEGDARNAPECRAGGQRGWVLHGLWPQYENGWPSYCPTGHAPPSRAMTRAMADIMGSAGLAWHQWNKHGRCTGLSALDYFELSRQAFRLVTRPDVFRQLDSAVELPASVVEQAFLKSNPDFSAGMVTITCRNNRIQDARFCLDKQLQPMLCGRGVRRDCVASDALLEPMR
ncbi:MAG: ribonuclease T2 [Pseudomonadota bacterium]